MSLHLSVTRGNHLEVVESMSTDGFIDAFRRFSAHHSVPSIVFTDNAKTFEKSSILLVKLMKQPAVQRYLPSKSSIGWRFIPKKAPWYGGAWERLVGLTKSALVKEVGTTTRPINKLYPLELQTTEDSPSSKACPVTPAIPAERSTRKATVEAKQRTREQATDDDDDNFHFSFVPAGRM